VSAEVDHEFLRLVGEEEPFALQLDEFLEATSDAPAALVGDDEILVPHAGLVILYAKGGKGKTTLTLDAVFHFASGVAWLGFPVPRPVRGLLIENEGPRELFRQKLAAKRKTWPHKIAGEIFVYTENWGTLRLPDGVDRLRAFIEREQIDLVVGDPLDSLGVNGIGSPEDTREFVEVLKACGLFRIVAWWLLHHGRKQEADDELDEISGAWGGRPDTMLKLDKLEGNRARLSFPKLRWGRRGTRPACILAFDPDAESFTLVGDEGAEQRDYDAEIEDLLDESGCLTAKEIAAPRSAGGIGANLDTIKKILGGRPERFQRLTGDAAKALGRHPTAVVWKVTRAAESPESPSGFRGDGGGGDLVTRPYRGVTNTPPPHQLTQTPEPPESDRLSGWPP
jgi:hypothetical protein